jgi:hypothetical protein
MLDDSVGHPYIAAFSASSFRHYAERKNSKAEETNLD